MTVRILFRKPYGPLKCNKIILNIMIIWTITQPVISWEFFKISFLQIIINYSTNSEKKQKTDVLIELWFVIPLHSCSGLVFKFGRTEDLWQWSCISFNQIPQSINTIPLYLSLLICTRYFFLSPFQPLRWLPFLNIFLLPFFVSFPVWPQWVHTREMQIKSRLCSQNGHILTSPCVYNNKYMYAIELR